MFTHQDLQINVRSSFKSVLNRATIEYKSQKHYLAERSQIKRLHIV